MRTGEHYAEFKSLEAACVGIVRPMPELDTSNFRDKEYFYFGDLDLYPVFLTHKTKEWGEDSVHTCNYGAHDGHSYSTKWDWADRGRHDEGWAGMESSMSGDTVGLLLDLDEGTLTVYRNNLPLGVMKDGLSGPFCWCTYVDDGGVVAIRRGQNKTLKGQRTLFDYQFSRTTVRRRPPLAFGQT
ncbi:hypothetical protein THAOC_30111 [Thalassiosira oceanica]|uniref:B30.2/SPRY domain-containing protein n=1 Tax=Thalassiosira oceanica TaxID=159749 RepID=K0RC70_THAOC|nr:hypothetical protein THAOC_30111 [Thalassiosira oceanica]|eukprot:EJK50790.1 hypothetical protein THAOC_30111 [Thalassiosira oceanica]